MIENVKFAVYGMSYSVTYRRQYVGGVPVVQHVPGLFSESQLTLESEIVNGKEGDRMIRYRIVFERPYRLEAAIVAGSVVEVTHRRHPLTNSWRAVSPVEQYVVQTDVPVGFVGERVNLGLIRKDQE